MLPFLKDYGYMLSKINRMKSIGRASGVMCALYRKGLIELLEMISITDLWLCIKVKLNKEEYIVRYTYTVEETNR